MTLLEKRERWRKLQRELTSLGAEVLRDTQKDFIELNMSQLKQGERADGKKIGRYADPHGWYAKRKFRQNPLAGEGNKDLINLGDWSEHLAIKAQKSDYEVLSSDTKHAQLMKDYGTDVLGLQDKNMDDYRGNDFMPELRKRAGKITSG